MKQEHKDLRYCMFPDCMKRTFDKVNDDFDDVGKYHGNHEYTKHFKTFKQIRDSFVETL
jgi:hypothetical protein